MNFIIFDEKFDRKRCHGCRGSRFRECIICWFIEKVSRYASNFGVIKFFFFDIFLRSHICTESHICTLAGCGSLTHAHTHTHTCRDSWSSSSNAYTCTHAHIYTFTHTNAAPHTNKPSPYKTLTHKIIFLFLLKQIFVASMKWTSILFMVNFRE